MTLTLNRPKLGPNGMRLLRRGPILTGLIKGDKNLIGQKKSNNQRGLTGTAGVTGRCDGAIFRMTSVPVT